MRKIIIIMLCGYLSTSFANSTNDQTFSTLFKNYHACFMLYNVNKNEMVSEYNPNHRCDERIAPDSTFKIPLSLMAFNEGIINQHTIFKWDGKKGLFPEWDQPQTAHTWLRHSVVWVSQLLTPQLGYMRIKHYLAMFHYGNQDFSGDPGKHNGLVRAWLSSSLKISANEQLHFLQAMQNGKLALRKEAIDNTKQNMYAGKLMNGANYYLKTGSGLHKRDEKGTDNTQVRDGWVIGFVDKDTQHYIFVSNLTDFPSASDETYGSQLLKPMVMKLLNDYFLF